jgi:2,4-dienoyl-CoA reductase-like NADH-dependent reductase (Old Yellow Enzyme family)
MHAASAEAGVLFEPVRLNEAVELPNRIVMAPMTRRLSPGGVPGSDVAAYYRRRAEGGVGLIVTEGTWVPHHAASNDENVPAFYGEAALAGWRRVVDEVHAGGAKIAPQLWHVGQTYLGHQADFYRLPGACDRLVGPSGQVGTLGEMPSPRGRPASELEIERIVDAFAAAAASARELGFDAVELHGAHGYIFDQFHWAETNLRTDGYGGDRRQRTRFACDVVREVKRRAGADFPVIMRMSQWKIHDYRARLAESPTELADVLEPMAEAGVDVFHCSQRRFWEGEFGSDLNLAGWAKKLTGRPSIAVGSVSLAVDFISTYGRSASGTAGIDTLLRALERGNFDMIAVGRALLADAEWPNKVRAGRHDAIAPYDPEILARLD